MEVTLTYGVDLGARKSGQRSPGIPKQRVRVCGRAQRGSKELDHQGPGDN